MRTYTTTSKTRPCMNCATPFRSTGPHHRLCGPCKSKRDRDHRDVGAKFVHTGQRNPAHKGVVE